MLPRLVLLGAGPAHLHALRVLARHKNPPRETVLVASVPTIVSPDMLPGFVAGRFRAEEVVVDLARLAHAARGSLVVGNVTTIEPGSRTVRLEGGRALLYNAASVTMDHHPATVTVPGAARHAHFIHTVAQVMALPQMLEQAMVQHSAPRILVVGNGTPALELALAIRQQTRRLIGGEGTVTILSTAHSLSAESGRVLGHMESALRRHNISLITGARIRNVERESLHLSNGGKVAFDFLLWAGDGEMPQYLADAGLQTSADGSILVDAFLQSIETPGLFAAGAAAAIANLPDSGQARHAGREGATLGHNLLDVLSGKPPSKTFDPPARPLVWVDTVDGRALATFGGLSVEGRWVARLKERMDRSFVQQLSRKGTE
ncbi:MAG: FAD-dependent oxidoreductase [Gemmatimonadota bacterium]